MAITCPNKALKSWKDLVKVQGESNSYLLWNEYEGNVPEQYYTISKPKVITPVIKPGVKSLFESNSELAAIGSPEQYSAYLDTIFPDSKIKDIVYHHSANKIEQFDNKFLGRETNAPDTNLGFFFAENKEDIPKMVEEKNKQLRKIDSDIILNFSVENQVLINSKNPKYYKGFINAAADNEIGRKAVTIEDYKEVRKRLIKDNDALIYGLTVDFDEDGDANINKGYVVFEPEQIHVLGSKQDIEGFKKFVQSKQSITPRKGISELFSENPQLASIGTQEQYERYLSTIFPDSKVRNIVYRGSEKGIKDDSNPWLYFSDSINDAYIYAKAHISKSGQINERNPVPAIRKILKDYFDSKYGKDSFQSLTIDKDIYLTQIDEDKYELNLPEWYKENINLSSEDKDLLNKFNRLDLLYDFVKIESEADLTKPYDDNFYIENIGEYKKLRGWFDNKFGLSTIREKIGKLETAILNIKNPYVDEKNQEDLRNNQSAYKDTHDGAFLMDGEHFLIKNKPEQIHILGSKQDIEGFKEFVNKDKEVETDIRNLGFEYKDSHVEFLQNKYGIITRQGKFRFYPQDTISARKDAINKQLVEDGYDDNYVAYVDTVPWKDSGNSGAYKTVKIKRRQRNVLVDNEEEFNVEEAGQKKMQMLDNTFETNNSASIIDSIKKLSTTVDTSDIGISNPRMNPDNPEALSFVIIMPSKEDPNIGDYMGQVNVDKDTGRISSTIGQSGVDIEEEYRGKGYGIKVYLKVAEALAEKGMTLKSEAFGKSDINEAANRVWRSLIKRGYAVDRGEYYEVVLNNKKENVLSEEILEILNTVSDINVPVEFKSVNDDTLMSTDGKTIWINLENFNRIDAKGFAEAFVHELVHIKTVNALENPTTEAEKFLSQRVKYIFNKFKRADKLNRYGGTDEVEFVAELLSKQEFRQYVKSLENGTLWERIKNFIAEFLGLNKGSDKLIKELTSFLEKNTTEIKQFRSRNTVVDTKTKETLKKIIKSTGIRLQALELRRKGKIYEETQTLLDKLIASFNKTNSLQGIVDYADNISKFFDDIDKSVDYLRQKAEEGDFNGVIKLAGDIRSMGNFAFAYENITKEIYNELGNISAENPTEKDVIEKIRGTVEKVLAKTKKIEYDYNDLSKIIFAKFLLPFGFERSLDDIEQTLSTPVKDITSKQRWMDNLQESGDDASAMIDVAIKRFNTEAELEIINYEKDLLKAKEKLEKAGIKDTKFLVKKDSKGRNTHYFVTERDIVGFREKQDEFRKYLERKYGSSNSNDDTISAQAQHDIKVEWNKFFRENSLNSQYSAEAFDALLKEKREELGDKFNTWFSLNSIEDRVNNTYTIPKATDSSYKSLHSDPLKSEFYWKVTQSKYEMEKHFPDKFKHTRRLPQIRKDWLERVKSGGWKRMFEVVKEKFVRTEDDTQFGNEDFLLKDESNRVLHFVPVYFMNKIKNVEDLSTDVVSSMIAFANMAIKHNKIDTIIDILELGKDVIKERGIAETSNRGQIIKKIFKVKGFQFEEIEKKSGGGNILARVEDYFNMMLYGQERNVGKFEKTIDTLGAYTGMRMLAGNVYAFLNNINVGSMLSMMESINGQFFDTKSLLNAEKTYWANVYGVLGDIGKRRASFKLSLWGEEMNVKNEFEKRIYEVNAEEKTRAGQLLMDSPLQLLSNLAEHYLHNKVSLAIADTYRYNPDSGRFMFKDEFYKELSNLKEKQRVEISKLEGKNVNDDIRAIKDKYKPLIEATEKKLNEKWNSLTNYWDAHEIKDKRLVLKQGFKYNLEDKLKFIDRQRGTNNIIQGMYGRLDKSALQKYAVGRLAIMFRKWIMPAWNRRFSSKYTNHELQMEMEGYYTSFGHFISSLWKDWRKNELSIMRNWNSLTELEKANMRHVFTDMAVLAAIGALVVILGSMRAEGDDDDWMLNMTSYQVNRLFTETGALIPGPFMLTEGFKILNSPAAGVNAVQEVFYSLNMFKWFHEIERGKYEGMYVWQKNLIRTVPLGENIYSIWYPEEKLKYFTSKNW